MTTYSNDTYRILRNTRLLEVGELDGKRFIRCLPPSNLSSTERLAWVSKAVAEINEPGVVLASNHNYGGDYLRVELATKTYGLIGWMLS